MIEQEPSNTTWHHRYRRRMIAAGAAAALLVGGGAALAATQPWSPKQERQAVIADAANRLGVTPQKLDDALTQALLAQVDQAVKDGRLTQQQGDAMKARINSGDMPMLGPGGGPGWGGGRHHMDGFGGPGGPGGMGDSLATAAAYLGLKPADLQTMRESGKTLEKIATDRGKSVDGLKKAMHDGIKAKLDAAVKAGKVTQAQADQMLAGADQWIAHEVTENEANDHHGFGGAPGGTPPASPWGSNAPAPPVAQGA